jgi:hypothetical protein
LEGVLWNFITLSQAWICEPWVQWQACQPVCHQGWLTSSVTSVYSTGEWRYSIYDIWSCGIIVRWHIADWYSLSFSSVCSTFVVTRVYRHGYNIRETNDRGTTAREGCLLMLELLMKPTVPFFQTLSCPCNEVIYPSNLPLFPSHVT